MKRVQQSRSRVVETGTGPVIPCSSLIRPAHPEEASIISDLAVRSKGHWGYDSTFLEDCRADLTVTPAEIAHRDVFVCENAGTIVGFYSLLSVDDAVVELNDLFVDPVAIGQGVGKRLWLHAVARARQLGFQTMTIQSDPHAEGFYLAMGTARAGARESTVTPGRMLPLLRYHLSAAD